MNCIDCLDRTNNAMSCISSVTLARQLQALEIDFGKFYSKSSKAVSNELLSLILNIFGENGDKIAQQYAGSDAFHKAQIYKTNLGDWKTLKQNIALIAVKRYISNTLLDSQKQRCLWLFLGEFVPTVNDEEDIWNLNPEELEKSEEQLKKNKEISNITTEMEQINLSNGKLSPIFLREWGLIPSDMKILDIMSDPCDPTDFKEQIIDFDEIRGDEGEEDIMMMEINSAKKKESFYGECVDIGNESKVKYGALENAVKFRDLENIVILFIIFLLDLAKPSSDRFSEIL